MPAQTSHFEVVLCGVPLEAGNLTLHGIVIKAFHVYSEHPIGKDGKAVPLHGIILVAKEHANSNNIDKHEKDHSHSRQSEENIKLIGVAVPLPLLTMRYAFHGSALSLFVGERYVIDIIRRLYSFSLFVSLGILQ